MGFPSAVRGSDLPARILILGLDGATWDVIDALGDQLPNLSRLRREGAWAPLRSTTPAMTLPAWSSILTGCNPGVHGILDFTRRPPGSYQLEFLNSTCRRVPTIHRILSDRGGRVASFAVPGTFPPEPLNGVVLSGFDSPIATRMEALHCEPASLFPEIEARFGAPRFADFQESDIDAAWHRRALSRLLREIDRKEATCRWLLGREEWDLFMVVFGESDTVAHHFWMFHDPSSPRHRADPLLSAAIAKVYRRLDTAVGELTKAGSIVCVCSDHGFGGAGTLALYLNRFLEAQGWLTFRETRGQGVEPLRQLMLRLPMERVLRRVPSVLLGRAESAARFGEIDFSQTRAWSDELNYAATIHLNLKGREPLGMLPDRSAAIRALSELLLSWRVEGRQVVQKVTPREEAMAGPATEGAPDLYLDLALEDGFSATLLPSGRVPKGTLWRRLKPEEWVGGKGLGMNGSHRPEGVLLLHGPGVRPGRVEAGVADVLPTLLSLTGRPVPLHCDGRVIREALEAPEERREPLGFDAPVPHGFSAREDDALRKKLERLGYL